MSTPLNVTKVMLLSFVVMQILATSANALMVTCYQSAITSNATVTISPSIINQCTVSAYLIVDVASMNTNAGVGTTPLEFTINATTIASPYHLVINGFATAAEAMAATHPLYATITLSTFVNGMIALYGQYPPGSIINVHHNDLNQITSDVFSSAPPHQHFFGAIGVGLYGGSQLLMEHNNISMAYNYSRSLQCLMIIDSYTLDDESLWSLSNNTIDVLNPTADALGLYIYKSTTTAIISNYSRLLYGDNNVRISSPNIAAFFIAQNLPQLYYNGSTVEIMTNTVVVSGGRGKNCAFSLDYWANGAVMTATLNSRIIVEGNVIQMNSTTGSINGISLGNTQMTLGSEFSVSNNVFYMAQNATVVIGIEFKLNISLSSGNININSNRMITCSNSLGMAYVTTGYSFGVSSGGQFLFTRNVIEEASTCVTTGALPPLLYGPVVPSGTGVFFLCPWNRYGGKMVYNPQKDYTTAMVSSYAVATDACYTPSSTVSQSIEATHSSTSPPTPSLSVTITSVRTASGTIPTTPTASKSSSSPQTPTTIVSSSLSQSVAGFTRSVSLPQTTTPGPIPSLSRTVTAKLTPTQSPVHTLTVPATSSNPRSSTASAASITPTGANLPSLTDVIAALPLFTSTVSASQTDVTYGFTRRTALLLMNGSSALYQLLMVTNPENKTIPITSVSPMIVPPSITGNPKGFMSSIPRFMTITFLNESVAEMFISGIESYSIDVAEGLSIYTTLDALFGAEYSSALLLSTPSSSSSVTTTTTPLLVATIIVNPDAKGTSAGTTGVAVGVGIGGMLSSAAELQGLGALALIGCSDPQTSTTFGSFRILSPVAVFDSYAGVIIGNALLTGVVGLLQLFILVGMKVCGSKGAQRTINRMAAARFPSFTLVAALAFHVGTAFSSARIISDSSSSSSSSSDFESWEVFVGVVGFIYSLLLPLVLMLHPYFRIGRAYQEYQYCSSDIATTGDDIIMNAGGGGGGVFNPPPPWVVKYVLPRGAVFSIEARQAYGSHISELQAPPNQVIWTSLGTWTSVVFLIAGLFHPNQVPHCQALYICIVLVFIAFAVIILYVRPLRSLMGCCLLSLSFLALSGVAFSMAGALVQDGPSNESGTVGVIVFAVILGIIGLSRLLHRICCWWFDRKMHALQVELTTVWVHILGKGHKVSQQFQLQDDDDAGLTLLAGSRDIHEVASDNAHASSGGDADGDHRHPSVSFIDVTPDDEDVVAVQKCATTTTPNKSNNHNRDGGDDDVTTPSSPPLSRSPSLELPSSSNVDHEMSSQMSSSSPSMTSSSSTLGNDGDSSTSL